MQLIGDERYGEMASQEYDLADETLRKYEKVCKRIPVGLRRPNLTFTHHEYVAFLTPDEQKYWLDKTEAEGWSTTQLRKELGHNCGPNCVKPATQGWELALRRSPTVQPSS